MRAMTQVENILSISCNFKNSRGKTVTTSGTCTVTPLLHMEVQYDIAKVFNVECSFSIKLENYSFI